MNNSSKKFIVALHTFYDGNVTAAFKDYLIENKYTFLWIEKPLIQKNHNIKNNYFYTKYCFYEEGKEKINKRKKYFKLPSPLWQVRDLFSLIFLIMKEGNLESFVFIGFDIVNSVAGVLLKKFGFVKKTVYYNIDYSPTRLKNSILNYLYHKADHFCVRNANETWNPVEKRVNWARKTFFNFNANVKGYSLQKELVLGFWKDKTDLKTFEEVNKKQIVFLGSLLESSGILQVLLALPKIVLAIPDVTLVIIGAGILATKIGKMCIDLHIEKNVNFIGYLRTFKEIQPLLLNSAIGVATYLNLDPKESCAYYADSGKIKEYLGCGLPVVASRLQNIASELETNRCGVIVDPEPESIASGILKLLKDEQILQEYRNNIKIFRTQFDWNIIFKNVLKDL